MNALNYEHSESTILARVISPESPTIPTSAATEILKWGFGSSDHERMSALAAKAREGSLSDEEQVEIEGYERVSSFLGLIKSKARRSLQHNSMT